MFIVYVSISFFINSNLVQSIALKMALPFAAPDTLQLQCTRFRELGQKLLGENADFFPLFLRNVCILKHDFSKSEHYLETRNGDSSADGKIIEKSYLWICGLR